MERRDGESRDRHPIAFDPFVGAEAVAGPGAEAAEHVPDPGGAVARAPVDRVADIGAPPARAQAPTRLGR